MATSATRHLPPPPRLVLAAGSPSATAPHATPHGRWPEPPAGPSLPIFSLHASDSSVECQIIFFHWQILRLYVISPTEAPQCPLHTPATPLVRLEAPKHAVSHRDLAASLPPPHLMGESRPRPPLSLLPQFRSVLTSLPLSLSRRGYLGPSPATDQPPSVVECRCRRANSPPPITPLLRCAGAL
jgi:hypothetical protein